MPKVIFEKTVKSVVMKAVGSKLLFDAAVDGELVTIRRLHTRKTGEQDFSELVITKDMLSEIYEAVELEIDNRNKAMYIEIDKQNKAAHNKMLDDMMPVS
jgi:hypothetical protein